MNKLLRQSWCSMVDEHDTFSMMHPKLYGQKKEMNEKEQEEKMGKKIN